MGIFDLWDDFDFDSASKAFVNEMIKAGAELGIVEGLTQTETKRQLRMRGFKFGNAKFSSLWRGIQEEASGFAHFANVNINDVAFDDLLPQRTYFKSRYRYVGSFIEIDNITNTERRITLAIDTNRQLTRGEVRDILSDKALMWYGATEGEINSLTVDGALINRNYDLEL